MIIYKTFKTPNAHYVYDRDNHSLLKITEQDYALMDAHRHDPENTGLPVFQKYQKMKLLQDNIVKELAHPEQPFLSHHLNHRIQNLILQVTQRCNLRCSYCAYSGLYYNRDHENKDMSFETAQKAIDFMLQRSDEIDKVVCSFYGGEPLLKLDLIKQCVNYVLEKREKERVIFNITTNGTLLTPETAAFLASHDFSILISLDGSKKEHDVNRTYANGRGSFDDVMKNVRHIIERYPDFAANIMFNAVLNPHNDYGKVKRFFQEDSLFVHTDVMMNIMDDTNLKENHPFHEEFYCIRNYDTFRFYLYLLGKTETCDTLPKSLLSTRFIIQDAYANLRDAAFRLSEKSHHGGPCIPGSRLFVNADGRFYPCERVSECAEAMCIGNLETGFSEAAAGTLLNIGQLTPEHCRQCWCMPLCNICAKFAEENGVLTAKAKLKNCVYAKQEALKTLLEICLLKEYGYDFEGDMK